MLGASKGVTGYNLLQRCRIMPKESVCLAGPEMLLGKRREEDNEYWPKRKTIGEIQRIGSSQHISGFSTTAPFMPG